MKTCANCRLWRTLKCWSRKYNDTNPGPNDWCKGHRLVAEIPPLEPITRKVNMPEFEPVGRRVEGL